MRKINAKFTEMCADYKIRNGKSLDQLKDNGTAFLYKRLNDNNKATGRGENNSLPIKRYTIMQCLLSNAQSFKH